MSLCSHLLVGQVQEAHEGQGHGQVGGHGRREPVEKRDQSPRNPRAARNAKEQRLGKAQLLTGICFPPAREGFALGTPRGIFPVPFPSSSQHPFGIFPVPLP